MGVERKRIVVVGGGGHAKVVIGLLDRLREFEVLGYVDPRDRGPVLGYGWLGNDGVLPGLARPGSAAAVIAVGKMKAGRERTAIANRLRELGYELPVLLAPTACVARDASLGEGTVVLDGAVIQPGSVVGRLGIINCNAVIGHDCVLGDDVHIAPSAALSGAVEVGAGSYVGVLAAVVGPARIGDDGTVPDGAAVVRSGL